MQYKHFRLYLCWKELIVSGETHVHQAALPHSRNHCSFDAVDADLRAVPAGSNPVGPG